MLVATILSAQCTDKKVNEVTQTLFKKYRSARDYAEAELAELEADIRPTGFFHNKAKSLKNCCTELIRTASGTGAADPGGTDRPPGDWAKNRQRGPGKRLWDSRCRGGHPCGPDRPASGADREKDPVKIEWALMPLIPKNRWILFSHQLIAHGRSLCPARSPKCPECPLRPACDYGSTDGKKEEGRGKMEENGEGRGEMENGK